MAKLLLLTDTHFGISGGNVAFHENMKLFYRKVFFPYLKTNISWIDAVVHLGDVFHDRRKIDTLTAKLSREYFFSPLDKILAENGKKIHIIAGNHDSFFRDELDTNSLNEFIVNQDYNKLGKETIKIYTSPVEVKEWNVVLVPWITKSNRERTQKLLADTQMKNVFGHLELQGFNFSKVQVAMHGDKPETFSKFSKVLSGHYHYKHQKDNIFYLGSPTQQTWIDLNTPKGFHVFDTETGELEFIKNPYNFFEEVNINDLDDPDSHPRHYRVLIDQDLKQSEIDNFVQKLYKNNALTVTVRSTINKTVVQSDQNATLNEIEDTPEFIKSFVNDENLASLMIDLYNRAVLDS